MKGVLRSKLFVNFVEFDFLAPEKHVQTNGTAGRFGMVASFPASLTLMEQCVVNIYKSFRAPFSFWGGFFQRHSAIPHFFRTPLCENMPCTIFIVEWSSVCWKIAEILFNLFICSLDNK